MKFSKKWVLFVGVVAALAFAGVAAATITFDPSTGTGFVGKGDVQLAFGWNNAQLQTRAAGVTFSYSQTVDEQLTCTDGNSQTSHSEKTGTRSGTVGSNIVYNARVHQQIDGFNLTSLGDPIEGGVTYSNGDPSDAAFEACVTNFPGNVTVDSSNNGPLGLYVSYDGSVGGTAQGPILIWTAP